MTRGQVAPCHSDTLSQCRSRHSNRATVAITGRWTQSTPRSASLSILASLLQWGCQRVQRVPRVRLQERSGRQMSAWTAPGTAPGPARRPADPSGRAAAEVPARRDPSAGPLARVPRRRWSYHRHGFSSWRARWRGRTRPLAAGRRTLPDEECFGSAWWRSAPSTREDR